MRETIKNYKVLALIFLIIVSFLSISFNGLKFGVDFKGGTLFQVHLAQKPTPDQLSTITTIMQQRLDSFGLKDTSVKSSGEDFVVVQIAETDPKAVEELELLIKTQGKFESILDQQVLFTGSDLIQIIKDPARGYGYAQKGQEIDWSLPFRLSEDAARNFSKGVFHKCDATTATLGNGQYNCKATYFFIDRPANAVLVLGEDVFEKDRAALLAGSSSEDINPQSNIEELLSNSMAPYFLVGDQNGLTQDQKTKLQELALSKELAIVHPQISEEVKQQLRQMGFKVKEFEPTRSTLPWVWAAIGAKQTISLTPGITGFDPYVADIDNAQIFSTLVITGRASDFDTAKKRLSDLTILLETGSLPIPIDDVSKETISPFLGKEFLDGVLIIGFLSLLVVALIVLARYRNFKIAVPIIITGASEVMIILGFASFVKINLDLSSVAGILAVIGTGVDHQIIIMDELMKGEHASADSLSARVKRAFTIVIGAASTVLATMLPIIFFGFGLGKLLGFAVMTIVGVLIAVIITRPAYAEFAKWAVKSRQHKD